MRTATFDTVELGETKCNPQVVQVYWLHHCNRRRDLSRVKEHTSTAIKQMERNNWFMCVEKVNVNLNLSINYKMRRGA